MFCKFHSRNQRGFTLIELIIVIAILAILSAIALSRLNYNRATASNRVCNSKMGEIKKASEAYFLESGSLFSALAIDGNDQIVKRGYLKGIPSNPHGGTGNYNVTVDSSEAAAVTCAGITGITFGGSANATGHQ